MARPEKIEKVEQIEKLFKESGSYFVTDYQGLNVADITVLRKDLRENQVTFLVSKNTLFLRAAQSAGMEQLRPYFTGPTAIAFTQGDPATAARIIYDSFKAKERPLVKAFVIDEQLFESDDIKRLAELPTREVLLSTLVAAVESPLTSVIGSIDGFFRELIGSVDALVEKRGAEG